MKYIKLIFPTTIRRLHLCAFIFFCLCLTVALIDPFPKHDFLSYFIPQAELFAEGKWNEFFQKNDSPPWLMILGGAIMWITSWTAHTSVMLASVLGYSLAAYPIWLFTSKVWSRKTAAWSVLFYFLCHDVFVNAAGGLRTSWAICSMAFIILGTITLLEINKPDWKSSLILVFGWLSYCLNRDEGVFLLFIWFISIINFFIYKQTCKLNFSFALKTSLIVSFQLYLLFLGWLYLRYIPISKQAKEATQKIVHFSISCNPEISLIDTYNFDINYPGKWELEFNSNLLSISQNDGVGKTTISIKKLSDFNSTTIKIKTISPDLGKQIAVQVYQPQNVKLKLKKEEPLIISSDKDSKLNIPFEIQYSGKLNVRLHKIGVNGELIPVVESPFDFSFDEDKMQLILSLKETNNSLKEKVHKLSLNVNGSIIPLTITEEAGGITASAIMAKLFGERWKYKFFMIWRGGIRGLYLPFLVLAIPIVIWKMKNNSLSFNEKVLLWFLCIGLAAFTLKVFLISPYLGRRHVLVLMPILLGWSVDCFRRIKNNFIKHGNYTKRRLIVSSCMLSLSTIMLYKGAEGLRDFFRYRDRHKNIQAAKNWLIENSNDNLRFDSKYRDRETNKPYLFSTNVFVPYYANYTFTKFSSTWDTLAKDIIRKKHYTDFLIVDYHFPNNIKSDYSVKYPVLEDEKIPPGFELVYKSEHGKKKDHIWILRNTYMDKEAKALAQAGKEALSKSIKIIYHNTGHPLANKLSGVNCKALDKRDLIYNAAQMLTDTQVAVLLKGTKENIAKQFSKCMDSSVLKISSLCENFTFVRLKRVINKEINKYKIKFDAEPEHLLKDYKLNTFVSEQFIKISENKSYELISKLIASQSFTGAVFLGFIPYDENYKSIPRYSIDTVSEETVLIKNYSQTSNVIFAKSAPGWIIDKNAYIVYDADQNGNFTDLPNPRVSSTGISRIEKIQMNKQNLDQIDQKYHNINYYYKIHLDRGLTKDLPQGTVIRQHKTGESYIYTAASSKINIQQNTILKGNVFGISKRFVSRHLWWPGTKYVKVVLLIDLRGADYKDLRLNFKDIVLKEFNREK